MRHPPPALRRFLLLFVLDALAVIASYAWLDRPVARLFAHIAPGTDAVFAFITRFGISTEYLVIAAILAVGCALAARRSSDPARKRQHARHAWRAAFVFATMAGAGLAGDILKPVFGRARPRLYLDDGIFGFTWHGAHAAYWSFPSGHAITIVSFAAAVYVIERRLWPLYAAAALLVMASRVVLDLHYLERLLAGAFLAGTAAWLAAARLRGAPASSLRSAIALEALEVAHDVAAALAAAQGNDDVLHRPGSGKARDDARNIGVGAHQRARSGR